MTFKGVVDARSRLRRSEKSWGPAIVRLGLFLCLMLGLFVDASNVEAAELRQVRIGKHADYTRIVFELDQAAGYTIERMDPASDVAELVVVLSATSVSRRIQSSNSLIEQVSVEPSGSNAIARIRLTKKGLRLKEMVLANPPRIVLDVLSEKSKISETRPEKAPVIPKPEAVPSLDAPTFEEIVAQLPRDKNSAAARSAEPVRVVVDEPTISTPLEGPKLAEPREQAPKETAAPILPSVKEVARSQSAVPAEEKSELFVRTPRPMVVRTERTEVEGRSWTSWILFGGAALLLLMMGRSVARRLAKRGQTMLSKSEATGFGEDGGPQTFSDINPFGEFGSDGRQMTLSASGGVDGATAAADSDDEASGSGEAGPPEEEDVEKVEMISSEQVNENLSEKSPDSAGMTDESHQMIRDMNLRVEVFESRIEELVDARDRLERQVAAQTEELRVQRAAIARTQRAVRNLARSEAGNTDNIADNTENEDNEYEEEASSEPAFPDPDSRDEE
ncbi:MAG: hypothetical protein VCB25_06435 [Myxococcota bacterium]